MRTTVLSVVAATVISATSAFAADLPVKAPALVAPASPWDLAFGGALMSDYNFRGISQSDRGPSGTVYSETRYNVNPNWQFYVGSQYWAVALPTSPSCECDLYGGIRPTFGSVSLDFGYIYYWYPRETQIFIDDGTNGTAGTGAATRFPTSTIWTLRDTDFWEVYGKGTWEVVKDRFSVGANYYYSPSWLNSGAFGAYGSVTAKVTGPSFKLNLAGIDEVGWYVSGELGHYWLGTSNAILGSVNYPDYTTWNVGLAFTWKTFTLDLRYYDTDLSRSACFIDTGDLRGLPGGSGPLGQSKWCDATFIASLKFDMTLANLK